ncbi:hypothetical protein L207DRAFT_593422 [Hyaloscypha variabilis F]|uniref:Peptidase S53 activation domain-containing protein n=1 Tax=Hyaloscypha variabilis (strain UAMH 11265 / GT02V1 / F) TaxID=1149755 RepID=A0A2J6QSZ3_HYAVF|nr:hypothetical protein L207DRAFT_593422 [Hyaloscypha variabilis F]
MDVSDPLSPNYGKHWSPEKLVETFASSEATIDSVNSWFTDFGIAEESIILSPSRNWLRMDLTINKTQSLLKTEYTDY